MIDIDTLKMNTNWFVLQRQPANLNTWGEIEAKRRSLEMGNFESADICSTDVDAAALILQIKEGSVRIEPDGEVVGRDIDEVRALCEQYIGCASTWNYMIDQWQSARLGEASEAHHAMGVLARDENEAPALRALASIVVASANIAPDHLYDIQYRAGNPASQQAVPAGDKARMHEAIKSAENVLREHLRLGRNSAKLQAFTKQQNDVISNGSSTDIYQFARDHRNCDVPALQRAIIASGDIYTQYHFARHIPGANIKELWLSAASSNANRDSAQRDTSTVEAFAELMKQANLVVVLPVPGTGEEEFSAFRVADLAISSGESLAGFIAACRRNEDLLDDAAQHTKPFSQAFGEDAKAEMEARFPDAVFSVDELLATQSTQSVATKPSVNRPR